MFYFDYKPEDAPEVERFVVNSHSEGLNLTLSQKAAEVLHIISQAKRVSTVEDISVNYYVKPFVNTLYRKGFIRKSKHKDGGWEVSKVGAAVLVVCEAAGLIKEDH